MYFTGQYSNKKKSTELNNTDIKMEKKKYIDWQCYTVQNNSWIGDFRIASWLCVKNTLRIPFTTNYVRGVSSNLSIRVIAGTLIKGKNVKVTPLID